MRNPYDEMYQRDRYGQAGSRRDYDYDRDQDPRRWRSGRQHYGGSYNRDYDQERWRSGRAYGRDYDEEGWRDDQARDIDYERWYSSNRGRDEYAERDQERWGPSDQRSSGPYRHDYDENPRRGSQRYRGWYGDDNQGRSGGQGYTSFSRDYDEDRWRSEGRGYRGSYGRDYDEERLRSGGQSYDSSFDRPTSWSYTEFWLIPGPFTGRGPRGYQRSEERIKEEICDRLTQHGQIDASDMEVQVKNGEVTLTGSVPSREAKRMAEDAVESVQGVREVHNQLRVQQSQQSISSQWASQRQESMPERQQTAGQQQDQQRAVGGTENRS